MSLKKCTGWPFGDLDPRSRLWHQLPKCACLRDKVRTTHKITTQQHGSFIVLVMVITWLDFGEVLLEILILSNFLKKFRMCFFKVKHYFGHISEMIGPIDVKRKGSASVGYWVQYVTLTLTSLMTLTLDVSRSNFEIALSQELLVWLMWNENEMS